MQNRELHTHKGKIRSIGSGIARLMALPNAPRLSPKASPNQQAAYNGYWLAIIARYRDILNLQQQKGDNQWLPEYQPMF